MFPGLATVGKNEVASHVLEITPYLRDFVGSAVLNSSERRGEIMARQMNGGGASQLSLMTRGDAITEQDVVMEIMRCDEMDVCEIERDVVCDRSQPFVDTDLCNSFPVTSSGARS